jgi:histidine ammonia-lyase
MAPWASRKAGMILDNVRKIVGIEYMLASEAISLTEGQLGHFKLGQGTQVAFDRIRQDVAAAYRDTYMPHQSGPAIELVKTGAVLEAVEKVIGELL